MAVKVQHEQDSNLMISGGCAIVVIKTKDIDAKSFFSWLKRYNQETKSEQVFGFLWDKRTTGNDPPYRSELSYSYEAFAGELMLFGMLSCKIILNLVRSYSLAIGHFYVQGG